MEKGKEIFSLFPFFFLVFWGWGGGVGTQVIWTERKETNESIRFILYR